MTDFKANISSNRGAIDIGYVGNLLSEVYHVETPVYLPWFFDYKKKLSVYAGVEVEEELEYENAPVRYGQKSYGAFWLKGGKYNIWDYTGKLIPNEFNDLLMPLATMVDFDRPKVVSKTTTNSGTVKEIYGLGDWTISINGIILPDKYNPYTQQTVAEQMEAIQKFHEIAGSIEVEGQLFAQRKISRIVTESLSFKPVQGRPNMMQYSIEAVSDEDLLLTDIL
ncbi:DUF6046 domain-containing protein [Carboxylicivirga linearis]|uniref:DUF6046 domain-containing protein n=1 Tax=Carboxylicivirga linearis TaxID=1628157 RepID=A0ABS5JWA3_9BACT|nr:DUF6046 domain-containing protein [Carboxylicivirga linearis]MBS2099190.1 hypothetical protein [Carboxylicivirga linearis]